MLRLSIPKANDFPIKYRSLKKQFSSNNGKAEKSVQEQEKEKESFIIRFFEFGINQN